MNIPEVYCQWCAAKDYCNEKPCAMNPLPGHAEPECFTDPDTAIPPNVNDNYELPF